MCSGIKIDAKIAQAVVSINAFKGVEFGVGFEAGVLPGSQVMDEILWDQQKDTRVAAIIWADLKEE